MNDNCSSDLRNTAAAILSAPSQTVVTDLPRMTQLLNRLVGRTEGHTVERLEKIYSQLSQLIYRHRHDYNKLPLVEVKINIYLRHTDNYNKNLELLKNV